MAQNDRTALMSMVKIRRHGAGMHIIRLQNVSNGGLCATGCPKLRVSEEVSMDLPGVGTITGTVVWVKNGYFGIQFAAEIDHNLIQLSGPEDHMPTDRSHEGRWTKAEAAMPMPGVATG